LGGIVSFKLKQNFEGLGVFNEMVKWIFAGLSLFLAVNPLAAVNKPQGEYL